MMRVSSYQISRAIISTNQICCTKQMVNDWIVRFKTNQSSGKRKCASIVTADHRKHFVSSALLRLLLDRGVIY